MSSIGSRLKKLRKRCNLTQAQVSEITGISRSSIALYESDERIPSINRLIIFTRVYHSTLDYICGLSFSEILVLDNLSKQTQEKIFRLLKIEKNKINLTYLCIKSFKQRLILFS